MNNGGSFTKKIISVLIGYASFLLAETLLFLVTNFFVFLEEDVRLIVARVIAMLVGGMCVFMFSATNGDSDTAKNKYSLSANILSCIVLFAVGGVIFSACTQFEMYSIVIAISLAILCSIMDALGYVRGHNGYLAMHPSYEEDVLRKPSERMSGSSWRDSV